MGSLLRFPTRPSQAVRISRPSERIWIVDVTAPSPDCSVVRRFRSEREAVAYAEGFCDATGFVLMAGDDTSRNVA
jgi:hypothetical protein